MSSALVQAECAGIFFWLMNVLFVKRPPRGLVVAWHLVALALSFAAPATLAVAADQTPARAIGVLCALGVINGVLASVWCGLIEPAVSRLPMLGITLAGFASTLFLTVMAASHSRLF